MHHRPARRSLALVFTALFVHSAVASVHDIRLHTDSSPDLASIEDFVQSITAVWSEPEDQAIAIWRWVATSHLQSSTTFEDRTSVWDPVRFLGSYPNTFCGYSAAFITACVDVLGGDWRHRYVELADHTVCEVSWDAGQNWHMFDPSMVIYVRRHDGQIAPCADIAAPGSCALSNFWGDAAAQPGHLYLYHGAPESVTNPPDAAHPGDYGHPSGYRKATDDPIPYGRTLRNGAYSYVAGFQVQESFTHVRRGWRNRLHLQPGQTYTRFATPLGSGSAYTRLNARGLDPNDPIGIGEDVGIRSNGRWDIVLDTSSSDPTNGWHELDGIVHRSDDGGSGPALRPASGVGVASLVAKVDAANVLTSAQVRLVGARGAGDGAVLEVSRDAGASWSNVDTLPSGAFDRTVALDADLVGGAFELLVRVRLTPHGTRQDCGIDAFEIEAITQLNRMTMPRLQRGGNQVAFAAGPAQETLTILPTLRAGTEHHWTRSAASWQGLASRDDGDTYSSAALIPSGTQPGQVTWKVDAPTPIDGFDFGGSLLARESTANDWIRLSASWNGVDFQTLETFDASSASTWDDRVYARSSTVPVGARSVWLRYEVSSSIPASDPAAYASTGIQEALLQVHHEAHDPSFDPVEVTWRWIEHRSDGDVAREHTRIVRDADDTWSVNVGGYRDPTLEWIRVRLDDGSATEGYSDGEDVGPNAGYDKMRIEGDWIDDVALRRPYTVSRPAAAMNPDTGGTELTDGTVVPPTDWPTSFATLEQSAYWDGDAPLTVTVDLEGDRTVAALRVTSLQPNATYAHAGTITAFGTTGDGSTIPLGVIQHDDVFSPPGGHLDWGRVRSPGKQSLPAGGRMAYGYWLVLDAPMSIREIRLDIVPLAGYGVGLSEIQAFSSVRVTDWPDREVFVPLASSSDGSSSTPRAIRTRLDVVPNPSNPATVVTYELHRSASVRLDVVDVRGRVVRTLVDGWRPQGTHRARWDGRDDRGNSVASGRYFAVATWAGQRAVGNITLLR